MYWFCITFSMNSDYRKYKIPYFAYRLEYEPKYQKNYELHHY